MKRILITIIAFIIALNILTSGCRLNLENEFFRVEGLEIVWGNWESSQPSPNRMLSIFRSYVKPLTWVAPSKTFTDNFQDGNINGWTSSYYVSDGSGWFSIQISSSGNSLYYEGGFYLNSYDAYGAAWIKYSLGSGVTGLNWIYVKYWVNALMQQPTWAHYTKPYIKLSTGTITLAPVSGTGGDIAYNFTVSPSNVIVEFGIYLYVQPYPAQDTTLYPYGYIDNVYVEASKGVFQPGTTVTQFKVQCSSLNVQGKYVKATQTGSWDTCNVTVNVYHNVDSTSTWNLASTATYSSVTLPYTYSNWDSGWLNLLTGSYTVGAHTYYIKLEVKARGIDLDGNIVENSAYTIISLSLNWQNCWMNPSITMEVADGSLEAKYEYDPIHVTAALMVIVSAVFLAFYGREMD